MQSGYTCQRCLGLLGSRSLHQKLPERVQQAATRRWRSTLRTTTVQSHELTYNTRFLRMMQTRGAATATATATASQSTADSRFSVLRQGVREPPSKELQERRLLMPDDLFHKFSNSPIPEIRKRAAYMMRYACCPHPEHRQTRLPVSPDDLEARKDPSSAVEAKHVNFECPDCGIPVYCSEQHWADDYEAHLEICDTLRECNEDDHDLRSGRYFSEFEYPANQYDEIMPNMTNWDTLLYTREFNAIDDPRRMRQATRLLTYPLTVASFIHELSPYAVKPTGRLTPDGLRSLSALRYTLHPPRSGSGPSLKDSRPKSPPVRLFILGARAESSLPRDVWMQLSFLFPRADFHVIFIGPESMVNRDGEFPLPERTAINPFGGLTEPKMTPQMKFTTYVEYFHTMHKAQAFAPYDPYFDCFIMFHPGLGHPASSHEWEETLPQLLETKVPVLCTGYTEWDMQRDREWVMKKMKGEVDLIMEPGENIFRSLRWDLNDQDPSDVSCGNWGVWAFRGKLYETEKKGFI